MITRKHGDFCHQPYRGECLEFSTDGTRLGADIAHTMGTTDEQEIKDIHRQKLLPGSNADWLTGMTAEQREWEGYDDAAQAGDSSEEDF